MTVAGGEPRARLRDVYWIGGGSGAGKSTIARRLAARHDLRLYATDEVMADHGHRSSGKTSDPDTALANLLERDGMFTDRLREEATGLGLPVIDVDTTMTEDELTGRVARAFGLG